MDVKGVMWNSTSYFATNQVLDQAVTILSLDERNPTNTDFKNPIIAFDKFNQILRKIAKYKINL